MSDCTPDPALTPGSAPASFRSCDPSASLTLGAHDPGGADRPAPLACGSVRPSRRTSRTAFAGEPPAADDPLLGFTPYCHPHPRRNSITPARQRAFISALAASGIVTQAAREIGASLEALYRLRRKDGAQEFAAAWDKAVDLGVARLEDCALALALEGEPAPIVSGGKLLGWYHKRNVSLIQFLLRQRRSERFAEGQSSRVLVPGNPVYERLKAQWEAEAAVRSAAQSDAVLERINRKLDLMRERAIAAGEYVEDD